MWATKVLFTRIKSDTFTNEYSFTYEYVLFSRHIFHEAIKNSLVRSVHTNVNLLFFWLSSINAALSPDPSFYPSVNPPFIPNFRQPYKLQFTEWMSGPRVATAIQTNGSRIARIASGPGWEFGGERHS